MRNKRNYMKTTNLSFLLHIYLYISIVLFVISLILLGKYFVFSFTFGLTILTPFVFIIFGIVSLWNVLEFNDDENMLEKGFGLWKLPYSELKEIHIVNFGSFFSIIINKEWKKKIALSAGIHKKYKKEILEKLMKISGQEVIEEYKFSPRLYLSALLIVILAFYGITMYNIYSKNSIARIIPKEWKMDTVFNQNSNYTKCSIHNTNFVLPNDFQNTNTHRNFYYSAKRKTKVNVSKDIYKMNLEKMRFFYYVMNMRNSYDMFDAAYNSRYSLFMLFFKVRLNRSYENMEIYRFSRTNYKGFVTFGDVKMDNNKKKRICTIFVFDIHHSREIDFILINDSHEIDRDIVNDIVASAEFESPGKDNK